MKKFIKMFIFLYAFYDYGLSFAQMTMLTPDHFSLSAEPDKRQYYPYEPIFMKVCVKNESDTTISVDPLGIESFGHSRYHILDPNRYRVAPIRREYTGLGGWGKFIKPEESFCVTEYLSYYFMIRDTYGKYWFRFIYYWENKYHRRTDVFNEEPKEYKVADAYFEIIPHEDTMEREAIKELDPLMQKYYTMHIEREENILLEFEKFLEKYPNSMYAELVSISRIDYLEEYYYFLDTIGFAVLDDKERWRMLNEELEAHEKRFIEKRYKTLYEKKKHYYHPTLLKAEASKPKRLEEVIWTPIKDKKVLDQQNIEWEIEMKEKAENIKIKLYNTIKDSKVPSSYKEHVKPEALKLQEAAEAKRARNKKITIALIFLGILILIGGVLYLEYSSGKAVNKNNK